ncbi:MAG TPA: BTAD domain-containing putative transcriptional regulator [Caulobacteraceae bacterium]|jgi:TolB-like protein/DNA-binding SARP family transcriptional activator
MAKFDPRPDRARLRLLGAFRLAGSDGRAIAITNRRARALLAVLAFAPEQSATRERLCGLLWSDRGEAQARASLRQCILELKTVLTGAQLDILEVDREQISLKADALACDAVDLERALAGEDVDAAVGLLASAGAVRLLEDLELDGLYRDWLDQTRARLDQSIGDAVLGQLERLEARGDWPRIKSLAEAYLRRDPTDEAVVAAAIRSDVAVGAPSAAHRRFRTLQDALAKDIGAEPGAAVREALAGLIAPPAGDGGDTGAGHGPIQAAPQRLLAVLAFDNLSTDREMDYFSDGVSEEILQALARTTDLKVIARASSFQFRGRDKVTATVAARLRASHLLDGSVRRSGDRVRIAAALVDCSTETTVWSGRFDGDLSDMFALQDKIAAAVAEGLNLVFAPVDVAPRIDPDAYDLYLRARALAGAPPNAATCVRLLEEAVSKAPEFAAAWASLAMARAIEARWNAAPGTFVALRDRAVDAAHRAIALDAGGGLPLVALSLLEPPGRFASREALLDKAIAASPSDPEILKQAADFAGSVGRLKECYRLISRAGEIDPLNQVIVNSIGVILANLGRLPEAYATFEVARARWPDFDWLLVSPLLLAANLNDWETAEPLMEIARADASRYRIAVSTVELLKAPHAVRRQRLIETCERQLRATGMAELRMIQFMYAHGLQDEAFQVLARSSFDFHQEQQPERVFLIEIIFGATNVAMRRDPRFIDLCEKLGLCDYWAKTDRWPDCVEEVAPFYDLKAEVRARVREQPLGGAFGRPPAAGVALSASKHAV